jgi:hypothetical protein
VLFGEHHADEPHDGRTIREDADHVASPADLAVEVRVHLNVLPLSRCLTVAIFSYVPSDAGTARAFLSRVLSSVGAHQRYELSRLVLDSCENFVLNPDYVDSWTEDKRRAVGDYFTKTLVVSDLEHESPDLYLF